MIDMWRYAERALISLSRSWTLSRSVTTTSADPGAVLLQKYQVLLNTNVLKPDEEQHRCVMLFRTLIDELAQYAPAVESYEKESASYAERRASMRKQLLEEDQDKKERQKQETEGYLERAWSVLSGKHEDASAVQQAIAEARAREQRLDSLLGPPPRPPTVPKGIYLYGSVGSGKTMVMDLAYSTIQELNLVPKMRRLHFNRALDELHQRMHKLESTRMQLSAQQMYEFAQSVAIQERHGVGKSESPVIEDPMAKKQKALHQVKLAIRRVRSQMERKRSLGESPIGNALILAKAGLSLIRGSANVDLGWEETTRTASLLCFDEMQIDDPFTAVALKGVMEALMDQGTVIVCTSNSAPWDLNRHGVHEDLFSQFTERLLKACTPLELSSKQDYRLAFAQETKEGEWIPSENYLFPLGEQTSHRVEELWARLMAEEGCTEEQPVTLPVLFGRTLQVNRAAKGVARFHFDEICSRVLGPADYFAVANGFRVVVVTDVPDFSLQMRDRARRFITLVDELYNARTQLVVSAECPPHLLFKRPGDAPILDLEDLQFETAVEGSRLRTDLMSDGGVAPLGQSSRSLVSATMQQSGLTEKFAFARAVSRLYELTSPRRGAL
ncbi:probable AFG1-like ATPase [Coccomyxa sp. Obi]|nr:probable AFG1-like ATPase [Coccomyxa sp. Obi]